MTRTGKTFTLLTILIIVLGVSWNSLFAAPSDPLPYGIKVTAFYDLNENGAQDPGEGEVAEADNQRFQVEYAYPDSNNDCIRSNISPGSTVTSAIGNDAYLLINENRCIWVSILDKNYEPGTWDWEIQTTSPDDRRQTFRSDFALSVNYLPILFN